MMNADSRPPAAGRRRSMGGGAGGGFAVRRGGRVGAWGRRRGGGGGGACGVVVGRGGEQVVFGAAGWGGGGGCTRGTGGGRWVRFAPVCAVACGCTWLQGVAGGCMGWVCFARAGGWAVRPGEQARRHE